MNQENFLVRLKNSGSRIQDFHTSAKMKTTQLSLKWVKSLIGGKITFVPF